MKVFMLVWCINPYILFGAIDFTKKPILKLVYPIVYQWLINMDLNWNTGLKQTGLSGKPKMDYSEIPRLIK